VCEVQPLIVIFEDLHWVDEQTQEFLNLLAASVANAKILLTGPPEINLGEETVCARVPGTMGPWGGALSSGRDSFARTHRHAPFQRVLN